MNQAASTRWTGQRTVDCEHSLVHSPLLFCPPSRSEANQFKGWRHPVSTFCFVSAQRKRHIVSQNTRGLACSQRKRYFLLSLVFTKRKSKIVSDTGAFPLFLSSHASQTGLFKLSPFFSFLFEEENEKVNPKEIRKSKNSWNN